MSEEVILTGVFLLKIVLEVFIGHLVPLLVAPVVREILLYCIIGEMDTGLPVVESVL